MSIIEEKIKKNAKLFNTKEPSELHLERFQSKLARLHSEEEKKKVFKLNYSMMKFVASITILVAISLVMFRYGNFGKTLQAADLGAEYMEVEDYYASLSDEKLAQIDALVGADEDAKVLKEKAFRKITRLEENNESLKEEYIESNKDERVFGAVVTNYRLLTRALDKVIEGLNEHNYKKSNTQ